MKNELSSSQKPTVIGLIEKNDRDQRFIENWRPVSLLNVDSELISKTLALTLKNVLPSLISPNQTASVKNRFISESGRLISDILDVSVQLNIENVLVTIDIQKAVLKAFGFGKKNYIELKFCLLIKSLCFEWRYNDKIL